jgi:hypothetical protein
MAKQKRIGRAYEPPLYDEHVQRAIRAWEAGNASEGQQKIAFAWVVNTAAATYDQPFRPGEDGDRETAFACGRMFVGQQIVKMLKAPIVEKKDQ